MPIHLHIEAESAAQLTDEVRTLARTMGLGGAPAPVADSTAPEPADDVAPPPRPHATDVPDTAEPEAPSEPDTTWVDEHGVAFNPDYCSTAAEPFYASGKRKGQWKKRKGVDDVQYDAWYDGVRPEATPDAPAETASADPSSAFGAPAAAAATGGYPTDIGGFTQWTSERQQASQITQAHIDHAFRTLQLGYEAIMPGNPDAATNIESVCKQIESYGKPGQ